MKKKHLAHITTINGKRKEQTIEEHSRTVANYAGQALASVDLYHVGYLSGLLHDMGKAKQEATEYLEKAYANEIIVKGSVNHTFAAVKFMLERYYKLADSSYKILTCEIISMAAGMHHGLFDIEDPTGVTCKNGLAYRAKYDNDEICYEESLNNFFNEVADLEELDCLYSKACKEIEAVIRKIEKYKDEYKADGMFMQFSYLARLVTSAVIEGDRKDTAEFMSGKKAPIYDASKKFWEYQLQQMNCKIDGLPQNTPINSVRRFISDACYASGKKKGGIYRLTLPTGSGKTLSSMRYALSHAAEFEKKRIIFIIPLLSVLEQNAKQIHTYLDAEGMILEHHSNLVKYEDSEEFMDKRELFVETWDSAIVISTLFQLLNTLFSHKTSAVRRMNSLCNSIIIIDEIQSLPMKFTKIFSMAINFLADCCNATILLCSATQPAFETLNPSLHFEEDSDLINLDEEKNDVFKRTEIVNRISPEGMTIDEVADFAMELINQRDSLLIICNTKTEAKNLFKNIELISNDQYDLYHLSTAMCQKHREETLKKIGPVPGIHSKRKVICVATQMVEAGIDFSFECVIRIEAGVDSIVQAAGRCNRSNDWGKLCQVFVVRIKNERLGPLHSIAEAQQCFSSICSQVYDGNNVDYTSKDFIKRYYKHFFSSDDNLKEMKYNVKIGRNKDINSSITEMLSMHKKGDKNPYYMRQAFRTAGELCKVFDDEKTDVVVNYDDFSNECILNLTSGASGNNPKYVKSILRKLKPYTVGVFEYELEKLKRDAMVEVNDKSGTIILNKAAYNYDFGVSINEYTVKNEFLNI